jgi:HAD superfamily hydrolase (TIGR01459 family)
MSEAAPARIAGLSQIAADYDAIVCDVWGVLHNGRDPFPRAADALRQFRAERGPVVLLSNAPRLADGVETQFDRIGVPRDFYDAIVTSGEAARADLVSRIPPHRALEILYLGPSRDNPLFQGLNLAFGGPEDAELALCTGLYDDETEAPDDYRPLLERLRARDLLFLCANPDVVVQRGERLIYCAGAIARLYESLGGRTLYFGKPHPAAFHRALKLARRVDRAARPLVIGDGLETDIAGANRLGLEALFVASGIHGTELRQNAAAVAALLRKTGTRAVAWMPEVCW